MSAGQMNRRITLQKGNPDTEKWDDVTKVWADFKVPKMQSGVVADNPTSIVTWAIEIWRRQDVCKDWQVVWGSRIFSVLFTYETPDRLKTIMICKELVM